MRFKKGDRVHILGNDVYTGGLITDVDDEIGYLIQWDDGEPDGSRWTDYHLAPCVLEKLDAE